MYVLNKSLASGHPVARRLPAAWNTDGIFSQSCLYFPMAREGLKQRSLPRGAVSASHPGCSVAITPKMFPERHGVG